MFDDMYDILSQLVLKWERCVTKRLPVPADTQYSLLIPAARADRFGPKNPIDPADDFTRLAFDTIAYCAMSYRLNSFYTVRLRERSRS